MTIQNMKIEDLTPYENNPRINDEAVDAVAASIKEFGFKVPIVADKNNVIVAGHTRLKAAQKLGLTEVPVIDDNPNLKKMSKEELIDYIKELRKNQPAATVIDEDKPTKNGEHPTMKPIKLIGYQIQNSTRPEESVLDLFGGSGSTLIACEQLNRKCYTMEYDPKFVDVIIARWETLTGKEAVKIG